MRATAFASMECPVARAAGQVGDAWTLLILREAFKGKGTFADLEEALKIAPSTLSRKLDALCEDALLVRQRYQEHPPRDEYALTEKGIELLPIVLALASWGNRWLAPEGELIVAVDAKTGARLDPLVVDRRTKERIGRRQVALAAGDGASAKLQASLAAPHPLVTSKADQKS